jgi:hypothetical protein
MNRFFKFENTQLYKQFGSVLDIEPELVSETDYEYYTDTLQNIRVIFGCYSSPTILHQNTYINDNEDIPEDDLFEFKFLIDKIFEQYSTIHKIVKKKYIKREIRNKSLQEKEIQKRIRQEEKKKISEFNKAVVTCCCGKTFIRSYKNRHITGSEHKTRIEAIEWSKLNQNIILDNMSVLSDITDDSISFTSNNI